LYRSAVRLRLRELVRARPRDGNQESGGMAPQHAQANGDSAVTPRIEPGEFPFPLTGAQAESPYLTWLRNHSNYMAARGLFDYLRAVSMLGRGIIINCQ